MNTDIQSRETAQATVQATGPALEGTAKLAAFFRFAGAGAVVLSTLLYMLQGVENVDLNIRSWIYLVLMAAMAAGGYICRVSFADAKGARLFFALAVLLIPVQFSQLGGMVYQLAMFETSQLSGVWQLDQVSIAHTVISTAIATVLATAIAYAGFTILARYRTAHLVAAFLVLNFLLLVPFRLSAAGVAVPGVMLALMAGLKYRIYRGNSLFLTRDGEILQTIIALPFAVALARLGFHLSEWSGISASMIIAAYYVAYVLPALLDREGLREICLALGTVMAGFSWLALSAEHLSFEASTAKPAIMILPLIGVLFAAWRSTGKYHLIYRNLAAVMSLALGGLLTLSEPTYAGGLITLGLAMAMLTWGICWQERMPLLAGMLLLLGSIVSLLILSLVSVSVNIWVLLAIVGVSLVLLSSIIEKHGRLILTRVQRFWAMS